MDDAVKTPPDLEAKRRQLLAILLKEQEIAASRAPIPSLPRERSSSPLSFAQERLWVIDQLEPGNVTYNLPLALLLIGRLDVSLLHRTLNEVVRRHQVLRTTYGTEAGHPVQIVGRGVTQRSVLANGLQPIHRVSHTLSPESVRGESATVGLAPARRRRRHWPFDIDGPLPPTPHAHAVTPVRSNSSSAASRARIAVFGFNACAGGSTTVSSADSSVTGNSPSITRRMRGCWIGKVAAR